MPEVVIDQTSMALIEDALDSENMPLDLETPQEVFALTVFIL